MRRTVARARFGRRKHMSHQQHGDSKPYTLNPQNLHSTLARPQDPFRGGVYTILLPHACASRSLSSETKARKPWTENLMLGSHRTYHKNTQALNRKHKTFSPKPYWPNSSKTPGCRKAASALGCVWAQGSGAVVYVMREASRRFYGT